MAESALVERLKEDALKLVNEVVRANLPVEVACLANVISQDDRLGEREDWRLFLASPLVDEAGPQVAYQKIYDALRSSARGNSLYARIPLGLIKVLSVNDRVTADVFKIVKDFAEPPPIPVGRCRLGNLEARELYILYVSHPPAPWQPAVLKTDLVFQPPITSMCVPSVWPILRFPAGSVVYARVFGSETDEDPLLEIRSLDGRQHGITHKSNTKPIGEANEAKASLTG